MVWMTPDQMVDYPELLAFVVKQLPHLPTRKPKVFEALVKWSSLDADGAKQALQAGSSPYLEVLVLPRKHPSSPNYGRHLGIGDLIQLDQQMVKQLGQFIADVREGRIPTVFGYYALRLQARTFLESKLLHELVHWGYHQRHGRWRADKIIWTSDTTFIRLDGGQRFEIDAYGEILTAPRLGLSAYIDESAFNT